jgi:hypothetical protein
VSFEGIHSLKFVISAVVVIFDEFYNWYVDCYLTLSKQ